MQTEKVSSTDEMKIRFHAIETVKKNKSFLTVDQYVEATGRASRLVIGDNDGKTIEEVLFGKELAASIVARGSERQLRDEILLSKIPKIVKMSFLSELDNRCSNELIEKEEFLEELHFQLKEAERGIIYNAE